MLISSSTTCVQQQLTLPLCYLYRMYYTHVTCANSAVKSMWMTLLNLQGEAPLADFTVLGKVVTALLGMFAVGVFAVPTGIVASQFSGFVDDRQEQLEEQADPTTHAQENSSQQSDPTTTNSSSSTEPTVKLSVTVNLTNNSNTAANSGSSTAGTGTIESDTENARLVQEDNVPETSTSSDIQQHGRHSKHHHTLTPSSRRALDSSNSSSGSRSCMQHVYAVCEGHTWFGELFNKGIIALIILSVIQVRVPTYHCIYVCMPPIRFIRRNSLSPHAFTAYAVAHTYHELSAFV
jgi:hypothetical protein